MSLLDQSQHLFPSSVRVTVHQARNLRVKGKNGTNDAYAIIQVAKDKFSTAVVEKCQAPVWKEEASFDMPLFHRENAERCTLYIIIMHRAQVGLDKFLGQAVINLVDLYDDKSRKKPEWFKLVSKDKKEDKVRGEVLLDIQFMRNNMSASMFDLSMQDKPRSRISKLKDKVRGKKKDGFSDSASAIVPSVTQRLTDSEGEADSQSLSQSPEVKKKSKFKTLFAPKSNLQRNISQSMFTLGTLPEKNSSLSSSRSSGLNVESPEGKKKFKLLGHKRTGSSDSKVSLGAFSLLGRSKQGNSDQNNLCINGNHVYAEEAEAKSGSTLSLNSSGQGSAEDVRKHTPDAFTDVSKNVPVPSADKALMEQQRHQEEEKRRLAEEKRIAEAKRLEEEERYKAEAKRLQEEEQRRQQEEQERRRRFIEDETKRKKQKEEEEKRKKEEAHRMLEEAENQRHEEERRKAEEQKRQEEASMSDRLTSLFGMIRKKEEKKDEDQSPPPAPSTETKSPVRPVPRRSTNPFEDIPLSSDPPLTSNQSPSDHLKSSHGPQTPSGTVFLNRTAKVSAVKPRLAQILESEPSHCQTPNQPCPSPAQSESTVSSVSSESPDTFSNLHSSLAPPNISQGLSGSPRGSTENLSSVDFEGTSPTMADQKKRVLLPPSYNLNGTQSKGNQGSVREIQNPVYVEADGSQQKQRNSIPLPDYETLFPQKRHGVQGQTQWDHIIAEVNQKHRDSTPELMGPEMSVDGPAEPKPNPRSSIPQENPAIKKNQETKPVSSKKVFAPPPPRSTSSPVPRSVVDSSQTHSQNIAPRPQTRASPAAVPASVKTDTSGSGVSRDGEKNVLLPLRSASPASRPPSRLAVDTTPSDDQRKVQVNLNKEAPTAKPRQRASGTEPTKQEESVVKTDKQTLSSSNMGIMDKKEKKDFVQPNQIPSTDTLSKESLGQLNHNQEVDIFTSKVQTEQISEQWGLTSDDFDNIFNQEKTDPFAGWNPSDSFKQSDHRTTTDDEAKQPSPAFQRKNSQRGKKILPAAIHSEKKTFVSQEELGFKEGTTSAAASQDFSTKDATSTSVTLQHQTNEKTESSSFGGDNPTGSDLFHMSSSLFSSGPLPVVLEEPASQTENLSGGKTLLRAWVSPSEVQAVGAQNSSGGGLALNPRRPHPVKPLSSADSSPAVKEIKVWDTTPGKAKVPDSGPYSQLTQEELITLVVKQQTDLSRKDSKIVELEEYIDNLLVRVIEENPSILNSLNAAKPV